MKQHTLLTVSIELQASWASNEELLGRSAIIDELDSRAAGKFLQRETRMGSMAFAYEVEHEQFSRARVGLVVNKHLPGYRYAIHTKPIAASKDFAAAVHERRRKYGRRSLTRRSQNAVQFGLGLGR